MEINWHNGHLIVTFPTEQANKTEEKPARGTFDNNFDNKCFNGISGSDMSLWSALR